MNNNFLITLSKPLKTLVKVFLVVLGIGYFTGMLFVSDTTDLKPNGIVENYTGNEDNIEADVMVFKKSKREMLSILHTHFISLSIVFLLLGILISGASFSSNKWKTFIMIEPMISVLVTFGGIYLIWAGFHWMKYLVMLSGMLMTFCFSAGVIKIWLTLNLTSKD